MNNIMKIDKLINKNLSFINKNLSETIKNKAKEQKGGFLTMSLGTLGAVIGESINW